MLTKTAEVGCYRVSVTCLQALELQAKWLLDTVVAIHNDGFVIGDGKRIQFGWSILVFRKQDDRTLALCEPAFFGNPFEDENVDISCTLLILMQQNDFANLVGVTPVDVSFQDTIVIARECLTERELYLERTPDVPTGDSGWYIGYRRPVIPQPALESIFVFELLKKRPKLLPVLILPPGYLVIVTGNSISSVVNSNNETLYKDPSGFSTR